MEVGGCFLQRFPDLVGFADISKREKVTFMPDSEPDIVEKNRLLDRAIWRKWNKFVWSGLLYIVIGLVIIAGGLLLNTGPYSAEGLLVGLGVIVVIVGVIRLLIGIINPLSPDDLRKLRLPGEGSSPENE
jgi:hypothetical protein